MVYPRGQHPNSRREHCLECGRWNSVNHICSTPENCPKCNAFMSLTKPHICIKPPRLGKTIANGYLVQGGYKKGHKPFMAGWAAPGFKQTEKQKNALEPYYASLRGKPSFFKGKKHTAETRKKMSIAVNKSIKKRSQEDLGCFTRYLWKNKKSGLEIKMEKILNDLELPYKFVGNGEFTIGRKCPDFINTNGQKIALEVFYRKHKDEFKGSYKKWKANRIYAFKKYGWEVKFFNETEINKDIILRKLQGV